MAAFTINIENQIADFRSNVNGKKIVADASMLGGNFDTVKTVSGEVSITGIPNVVANWGRVDEALRIESEDEIREAADLIQSQSLSEVPFDEGNLADSFYRDESDLDASGEKSILRIAMGYATEGETAAIGSDGFSYAWRQHEDPTFVHPTPGTKMHYLIDPFNAVAEHFPDDLASRLKSVVESGGASGLAPGLGKGTGAPRLVKKAK